MSKITAKPSASTTSKKGRLTAAKARRESAKARVSRTREILDRLREEYPESRCALIHSNPLQLLVATILSAQCTDVRVNLVTPALFKRYPKAADYAGAEIGELEEMVRTTGFFRNKARSLKGLAEALVSDHGGKVPDKMPDLCALPGVGRKTANVVLGNAFGIDEGIVVDTHVGRISRRLALTDQKDAVKVETDLTKVVPHSDWTLWSHLLIDHGRKVCKARGPKCDECVLLDLCPSAEL